MIFAGFADVVLQFWTKESSIYLALSSKNGSLLINFRMCLDNQFIIKL